MSIITGVVKSVIGHALLCSHGEKQFNIYSYESLDRGCPTFRHLWATLEEESCLGPPIKYIATHNHTKKPHNVLSKFVILCWVTFIPILGCMQPVGCRLDTLGGDTII